MATGDKRVNIYNRRHLPLEMLSTYMYDYIRQLTLDATKAVYPNRGVFTGGVISASVADTIDITATEALDHEGHFVNMRVQNQIAFPNISGVTYYVGIRYTELEVPKNTEGAVEISPFSGTAQYVYYEENIGEDGYPEEVIDNGNGTITMSINTVVGSMDNSGRTARIWLTNPQSGNTGWYEDVVIQYGTNAGWVGNKNYITTTGNFHQIVISGSISTTVSDYRVWVGDVTITTVDISNDTNYIYLGTVLGNGPGNTPVTFTDGRNMIVTSVIPVNLKLQELAKEYYGDGYTFNGDGNRSNRPVGVFTPGDTSPNISAAKRWITANAGVGVTTITSLQGGKRGDIRQIYAYDNHTILQHSSNLKLQNSMDYIMNYGDNITLFCIGSNTWYEIGRTEGLLSSTSSSSSTTTVTTSSSSTTSSFSSTSTVSSSLSSTTSTIP